MVFINNVKSMGIIFKKSGDISNWSTDILKCNKKCFDFDVLVQKNQTEWTSTQNKQKKLYDDVLPLHVALVRMEERVPWDSNTSARINLGISFSTKSQSQFKYGTSIGMWCRGFCLLMINRYFQYQMEKGRFACEDLNEKATENQILKKMELHVFEHWVPQDEK